MPSPMAVIGATTREAKRTGEKLYRAVTETAKVAAELRSEKEQLEATMALAKAADPTKLSLEEMTEAAATMMACERKIQALLQPIRTAEDRAAQAENRWTGWSQSMNQQLAAIERVDQEIAALEKHKEFHRSILAGDKSASRPKPGPMTFILQSQIPAAVQANMRLREVSDD
jgi:chromosome segregation ATPase